MKGISKKRELIHQQRVASEQDSLLRDVAIWKEALDSGSVIHHHVEQFEKLCQWVLARMGTLYDPERWPNLDKSTFNSFIVSILSGKWVYLRQVVLQRAPGNPYLKTLNELDGNAKDGYERLRQVLLEMTDLKGLSSSPPLVYLGPIARLFLFDEEAPCLISVPFGAANDYDTNGKELSRQTIPHEVAHAIFSQIPGLVNELRLRIGAGLAEGSLTVNQRSINPVLLNWLDEVIADMAGTALGGYDFALSASAIGIMPDKAIGITDGGHPIPLIRPYIHAEVLRKLSSDTTSKISSQDAPSISSENVLKIDSLLNEITKPYMNNRFESLPAIISVSMGEVRAQLIRLVDLIWDTNLMILDGKSIGQVLTAVSKKTASTSPARELPAWGVLQVGENEFAFRLIGESDLVSPLPGSPLYVDWFCCPAKLQICCSYPVL